VPFLGVRLVCPSSTTDKGGRKKQKTGGKKK